MPCRREKRKGKESRLFSPKQFFVWGYLIKNMENKITRQQLVATNLKYSSNAKSLKELAYADLVAKALFLSKKEMTIKEIAKKVAEIIGVSNVSNSLIRIGLAELESNRKIFVNKNLYSLVDRERNKLKEDVLLFSKKLEEVVDNHFPKKIEKNKIIAWFNDAIVDFFEYNGDEWVQSVCRGGHKLFKKIKTADEILDKSIKKHSLTEYSSELKNAFVGILASEDDRDQNYFASVGYAMFSARLVAADIGADPLMLDELRDSVFLVDTNFLFALQLDSHKFAASMETLGKALNSINAELVVINKTKEEYDRALAGKKGEIKNLLNVYPEDVVMDANDDFIKTAISRGCKKSEDFDLFFGDILNIPSEVPKGPAIQVLELDDVEKEINKASSDEGLKNSIQKWCVKMRPRWWHKKSNLALEHDAALIYVAELEKKNGKNAFILTLDRGLQACCSERSGYHNLPSAIYLEGLLQIFAANNAGPDFDATNFAPLLSNILQKRCIPPEHTFSPEDLHWLYKIEKNVARFSSDKIKTIALEVAKNRLAGVDIDDGKLRRLVNRLYQEEVKNTEQVVEELSERTRAAEAVAIQEKERADSLATELNAAKKKELLRILRKALYRSLFWRIPLFLLFIFIAYFLIKLAIPNKESGNQWLGFVLNIIQGLVFLYYFLLKPIKIYKDKKGKI